MNALNRHLVIVAPGLIGMWAGRQLSSGEMFARIRRSWCEILLAWTRGRAQREVKAALQKAIF